MQSLDIISVNLWQILISLCNLLILFFILKKFLFKPVKKTLEKRQEEIDSKYNEADIAKNEALASKDKWEEQLKGASAQADDIINKATADAEKRSERIVSDAKVAADDIMRRAKSEAELEKQKAQAGIKKEIVDVSAAIAEKMLGREINEQDHHELIDSFIKDIGESDD